MVIERLMRTSIKHGETIMPVNITEKSTIFRDMIL